MIREDVCEPRGKAGAGDESAAEALWRERGGEGDHEDGGAQGVMTYSLARKHLRSNLSTPLPDSVKWVTVQLSLAELVKMDYKASPSPLEQSSFPQTKTKQTVCASRDIFPCPHWEKHQPTSFFNQDVPMAPSLQSTRPMESPELNRLIK